MDLFKQALSNLGDLESTVESTLTQAAKSVVTSTSEFPDRSRAPARATSSAAVAVARTKKAGQGWADVNWEARVVEWQAAAARLSSSPRPSGGEVVAQLAALYELLVGLPDPQPALEGAATLAARVTELEGEVRRLSAALSSAEADSREVGDLVAQHTALTAQHATLEAEHAALKVEVSQLRQAAGAVNQEVDQAAAATIQQLQASLAALRAEHDAAQSALFEAQAAAESAAGGRGRRGPAGG